MTAGTHDTSAEGVGAKNSSFSPHHPKWPASRTSPFSYISIELFVLAKTLNILKTLIPCWDSPPLAHHSDSHGEQRPRAVLMRLGEVEHEGWNGNDVMTVSTFKIYRCNSLNYIHVIPHPLAEDTSLLPRPKFSTWQEPIDAHHQHWRNSPSSQPGAFKTTLTYFFPSF